MAQPHQTLEEAGRPAAGSSFYYAMRILPPAQREGMFEIYSFCRKIDDIADSDGPRPERLRGLEQWRLDLDALYAGNPPPSLARLAHVVRTFDLAKSDFLDVIEGMEMDAHADIRAPDEGTLDLYCDRVASAVGRLSTPIFGMTRDDGRALSHELGRALQLTNILRDLDEDAAMGRLYLPRETLQAAGIDATDPNAVIADPRLTQACTVVAARARTHFVNADAIMRRASRRSVRAPRIMGEVYRRLLDAMVAQGWAAPRQRARVSKAQLALILLRYAVI